MAHFDIVPDIHGQTAKLDALLRGLGYVLRRGHWHHAVPDRQVVFLGAGIGDNPLVAYAWEPGARGLAVEAIVGGHGSLAPPAPDVRQAGIG